MLNFYLKKIKSINIKYYFIKNYNNIKKMNFKYIFIKKIIANILIKLIIRLAFKLL
jgi:hypothetical protein